MKKNREQRRWEKKHKDKKRSTRQTHLAQSLRLMGKGSGHKMQWSRR